MDTSKYQPPLPPNRLDVDSESLLEIYETFKAIDEVYNNSLMAMGIRSAPGVSVSGNTNASLSNIGSISTS
jgi:hypothetical protein